MAATPPNPSDPRRADFRSLRSEADRASDPAPARVSARAARPEPDDADEDDTPRGPRKIAGRITLVALVVLALITGSLAGLTLVYSADLPQINDLERYRPSTTTDLYDRKGRIIGSFALERRILVNYNDFAPVLRQAVLSIEDKSFESHWGVNVFRIVGAVWHDVRSHGRAQGASTLTMQLARNLFLSSERTATRKIQEAYLAIQIERALTKQQIFTLYGNQIYLGHGMYGFEAASEFYFSKHAKDLNLTEAALLAGLPKGPAAYSPLLNPEKCLRRRNLVLSEMESDGVITHVQAEQARQSPLGLHIAQPEGSVAPWFVEEVRQELEKRFGAEQVHQAGLRVDTTLDMDLQQVANRAVQDGVATYEHRHGWVGHSGPGRLENVLTRGFAIDSYKHPDWAVVPRPGAYVHAVVESATPAEIRARIGAAHVLLQPDDWKWTGQHAGDALVMPGDIIYVHLADGPANKDSSANKDGAQGREAAPLHATLEQDSGAQGSLMAIDNATGDVLAMVGGRDYALSQFDRATQSERQTGSSFKPYVYTAAIEDGASPDDTIVDGPVSFGSYTPHNYENDYKGRMTLENAFAESRNIPALKLAARVGIHKVIDLAHRFGVTSNIPAYLPVALGAVEITLEEQVASYSVFPNDGIRVQPRFIRKVTDADGMTLWQDPPVVKEVISQDTARTMMVLLRAVTAHGTGAAVAQMKHPFGGKTGTTSDYTDAWFLGFSPSVTCGVWVGFDSRESLGEKETGAKAALPIWMTVMKTAIVGKDNEQFLADQGASLKPDQKPARGQDLEASQKPGQQPPAAPAKPLAKPPLQAASRAAAASSSKSAVAGPPPASPAVRAGPAVRVAPPAVRVAPPAAKVPAKVAPTAPSYADPRVHPALPPQAAPPKQAATVKPALQN